MRNVFAFLAIVTVSSCKDVPGLPRLAGNSTCAPEVTSLCQWAARYDGVIVGRVSSLVGIVERLANNEGLVPSDAGCERISGVLGFEIDAQDVLLGEEAAATVRLGVDSMTLLDPAPIVAANGAVSWIGDGRVLGAGLTLVLPVLNLRDEGVTISELPLMASTADGTIEFQESECAHPVAAAQINTVSELRTALATCTLDADAPQRQTAVDAAARFPMSVYAAACLPGDEPGIVVPRCVANDAPLHTSSTRRPPVDSWHAACEHVVCSKRRQGAPGCASRCSKTPTGPRSTA